MISFADVEAAAGRIAGRVLRTPTLPSQSLSKATGCDVTLKLDHLQATGAFKEGLALAGGMILGVFGQIAMAARFGDRPDNGRTFNRSEVAQLVLQPL